MKDHNEELYNKMSEGENEETLTNQVHGAERY